ncbi:MAG: YciI family protein [Burkholderiaceae bacterium]
MRFMIMVRANAMSESGALPDQGLMAAMAHYHEQLAQAGVLLDANGLKPSAQGFRVRYHGGRPSLVDGPFAETKGLIAGYTLIQVRSREEAMEWARRFPAPFGDAVDSEIEVRALFELEDFGPGEAVDRFKAIDPARA